MGSDLAAGVPFYGAQPNAADTAKIKAPINAQYGELDTRITGGWPAFDAALTAAQRAARRPYLQRRQSRLPQRHDAALRRSRRQGSLAAHAGLVQQISERFKLNRRDRNSRAPPDRLNGLRLSDVKLYNDRRKQRLKMA